MGGVDFMDYSLNTVGWLVRSFFSNDCRYILFLISGLSSMAWSIKCSLAQWSKPHMLRRSVMKETLTSKTVQKRPLKCIWTNHLSCQISFKLHFVEKVTAPRPHCLRLFHILLLKCVVLRLVVWGVEGAVIIIISDSHSSRKASFNVPLLDASLFPLLQSLHSLKDTTCSNGVTFTFNGSAFLLVIGVLQWMGLY